MKKLVIKFSFLLLFSGVMVSCSSSDKKATEQTEQKDKYQCPMKCEGEKTYDTGGKCPECGMDMVKVGEE